MLAYRHCKMAWSSVTKPDTNLETPSQNEITEVNAFITTTTKISTSTDISLCKHLGSWRTAFQPTKLTSIQAPTNYSKAATEEVHVGELSTTQDLQTSLALNYSSLPYLVIALHAQTFCKANEIHCSSDIVTSDGLLTGQLPLHHRLLLHEAAKSCANLHVYATVCTHHQYHQKNKTASARQRDKQN